MSKADSSSCLRWPGYAIPAAAILLVLAAGLAFPFPIGRFAGFAWQAAAVWLIACMACGFLVVRWRGAGRWRLDCLPALLVLPFLLFRCGDVYVDYRRSVDEARALRAELARYQSLLAGLPTTPSTGLLPSPGKLAKVMRPKSRSHRTAPAHRTLPPTVPVVPPVAEPVPAPVAPMPDPPAVDPDSDSPRASALATARDLVEIVRSYHVSVDARYAALGLQEAVRPARLADPAGLKQARQTVQRALAYARTDLPLYDQAVLRGVSAIQQSRMEPEYKQLVLGRLDDVRGYGRQRVMQLVRVRQQMFERQLALIAFVEQHAGAVHLNQGILAMEPGPEADQLHALTQELAPLVTEEAQMLAEVRAEQQQGLTMLAQALKTLPF